MAKASQRAYLRRNNRMVLIQKRVGQLGNQLFNIAHFAAAALDHNFKVLCPCFQYPLDQFPSLNSDERVRVWNFSSATANRAVHRAFKLLRKTIPQSPVHECCVAEGPPYTAIDGPEFTETARRKLVVACEGFGFRACRSIVNQYDRIRELFRLSGETVDRVNRYVERHSWGRNVNVVGFHIRRGDYRDYLGGRYCYDDDAWVRWIDQARAALHSPSRRFVGILFSDEDLTSLANSADDLFLAPGSAFEDLHMLSRCNFILGPPSTFSGWASFIGRVPIMRLEAASVKVTTSSFSVVTW